MSHDSSSSSKPGKASPTKVDPEVKAKPERRQFSAEYKRRILAEADACTEAGQIGALLRREGLYSSNLTHWRQQLAEGSLKALSPKKRGPNKLASPRPARLWRFRAAAFIGAVKSHHRRLILHRRRRVHRAR